MKNSCSKLYDEFKDFVTEGTDWNGDTLGNLTDEQVNKVLKFISERKVHEHMEDLYDRVEEESE